MKLPLHDIFRRLGDGDPIAVVCGAAGIERDEFDILWQEQIECRLPDTEGVLAAPVTSAVHIRRDAQGIPHIFSSAEHDLFVGYGYAMAQDRLWQLDYLRRRAVGRLSEIFGVEALESDLLVRTVGLHRIAADEERSLPDRSIGMLEAFSSGVNSVMEAQFDRLPIEFELLGYEPEPWRPMDCLAIMGEFRWYLTGRFPVIVMPELAKRVLGEGPMYEAFLTAEAADETILVSGSYPSNPAGVDAVLPRLGGGPDDGSGSNNWVIGAARSSSGAPLLASDPHIAFGAVSCWHHAHLHSDAVNVAGAAYVGVPAIMIGRNEHVAWGITNNICSQRDLYLERTKPGNPNAFLYDGSWEPAITRVEEIKVRGQPVVRKTVRHSRNGPIVDEVLPEAATGTGPVSLRWIGATPCGWLPALQASNRARSIDDFREALRPWVAPTFSLVFADVDGHVGYQATGRIPVRSREERGYRHGWDPEDQWQGVIPFDAMPASTDPDQGWIATANNLPAPSDFPYPLSNTSPSGHRAQRIRQMIEGQSAIGREDCVRMQYDTLLLRAVEALPGLLQVLEEVGTRRTDEAMELLSSWDCCMHSDSAAAAIFEVFFNRWVQQIANQRFSSNAQAVALGDSGAFVSGGISGLALSMLYADEVGWFEQGKRIPMIQATFISALDELTNSLGPDISQWSWGQLHRLRLRHCLSARGDLGELLDRRDEPVNGNGFTVGNTGSDPDYVSKAGANYRLVVDLAETPPRLWYVDAAGESGHPADPNYCAQLDDWINGRYHPLSLDMEDAVKTTKTLLTLESR